MSSVRWLVGFFVASAVLAGALLVSRERALAGEGAQPRFDRPAGGSASQDLMRFSLGRAVFKRLWVAAPSSTTSADGLGPLYNARSCLSCHERFGRGRPLEEDGAMSGVASEALVAKLFGAGGAEPHAIYGTQLQPRAVPGLAGEGTLKVSYQDLPVTLADGTVVPLRKPTYSVEELSYGPLEPPTEISPRLAQPLFGLGLIEAIPEGEIRKGADPLDADDDGISGRVSEVAVLGTNPARLALGRFGWRASAESVRAQSAIAAVADIGLSSVIDPKPQGDCTAAQSLCLSRPNGDGEAGRPNQIDQHELSTELLDLVTYFTEQIAVPPRRRKHEPVVIEGERIFAEIGCAGCHRPYYVATVGGDRATTISPYSDFLMHDMGDGLADRRLSGEVGAREWRTQPLWGVGASARVGREMALLHDGRARSFEEAILWHGGEGQSARSRFEQLSAAARAALVAFLRSL